MPGLRQQWRERLGEYAGEPISYLIAVLCFVQVWRTHHLESAASHEETIRVRAASSVLNHFHVRKVEVESKERFVNARMRQYHKAEILLFSARVRFWITKLLGFWALRMLQRLTDDLPHELGLNSGDIFPRDALRKEVQYREDSLHWICYDWFSPARPIHPVDAPPIAVQPSKDGSRTAFAYHTQENSPLFTKLPTELRMMVYRAILTGFRIDIGTQVASDYGPPGSQGRAYRDWTNLYIGSTTDLPNRYHRLPNWRFPLPRRVRLRYCFNHVGIVSLLRTCRRVYIESFPLLYTENIWTYTSDAGLYPPHLLHQYLLPCRLLQIQHYEVEVNLGSDKNLYLGCVSHLPNLRTLCVKACDMAYESLFTGRQLWMRLMTVFLDLEEIAQRARVEVLLDDCIPILQRIGGPEETKVRIVPWERLQGSQLEGMRRVVPEAPLPP